jgi:hypothetical protein
MNLPSPSTSVAASAIAYVDAGFAVVPVYGVTPDGGCRCDAKDCKAPGKHPIGSSWQKRACRDLDAARDVFGRHDGNVGIYLGGSGFVVLDFDGEAGLRTRDALLVDDMLPDTLTARSGSGGEHRIYRFAAWHKQDEVSDRRVGVGWDVKRSGQFLVAPSRHPTGGLYEWIDESSIAELPDVLFERIRKLSAPAPASSRPPGVDMTRRARAYIERMPPAISGSGGHDATFAVARKLVQDFGLSEADAWAVLVEYNARCQPPWSDRELRHKLTEAVKARVSNPIEDRPRAVGGVAVRGNAALSVVETEPSAGVEGDWRQRLLWTSSKSGAPKLVVHTENVVLILQLHPEWRGLIRYDEFRGRTVLVGRPPWSEYHRPTSIETVWTDEDATRLESWLRREFHSYAFAPTVSQCERAVDVVARTQGFNPVRDYLDSVAPKWDGTMRLPRAASLYFGADDTEYSAAVFTWWMISAVARVFEPGCKADHVLILEGDQNLGKSTALEVLCGSQWFSDSPIDLNSKDAFERIRGRWIVELAELDSLFRTDASRAKQFFSSKRDDYRPAYGRREREQLRQCIFAGTVNLDVYLNDPTGARRFWPFIVRLIRLAELTRDRDQLWAEAVWRYREGQKWYPTADERESLLGELKDAQADRTQVDVWTDRVMRWLRSASDTVATDEILGSALMIDPKDWTKSAQIRVGIIMKRAGWSRKRVRNGTDLSWAYQRVPIGPTLVPIRN